MAGPGKLESISDAACDIDGVREVRGDLHAAGLRIGIVAGRFHTELTSVLASELVRTLLSRGAEAKDILVVWVPGTFELAGAVQKLANHGTFDVLIALGAVVEGETSHAQMIVSSISFALCDISRHSELPVIDGVVSAPSYDQAKARCVPGPESRARYLADAATEVARVHQQIARGNAHG
jgi:6,7-dimethyl-8-ribityllumazine synthase